MRVLLVTHRFPPDGVAGVERYTDELAKGLTRRGDDVAVVTKRSEADNPYIRFERQRRNDGVTIYAFDGKTAGMDRFLTHRIRNEILFSSVMAEFVPDVVHINHLLGFSPGFVHLPHRFRIASVLTLHDFYFACPLVHLRKLDGTSCEGPDGGRECMRTCFSYEGEAAMRRWVGRADYFKRLLLSADSALVPSSYVRDFFLAQGIPEATLRIVPHGLPNVPERPIDSTHVAGLRIAFIGSVTAHKGVHVLVEALSRARLSTGELLIIGKIDDPEYAADVRYRAGMITGVRVKFFGSYEPNELSWLLRDVDVVVIPSTVRETFSFTAREALLCGVPILVSRQGALPESVKEGVTGFVFDGPEDLAELLQRLSADDALKKRLKVNAGSARFISFADHLDTIRTIYDDAIERHKGRDARSAALEHELKRVERELTPIAENPLP